MYRGIARAFRVEELAISAFEEGDDILASVEPEAILALRKESKQLLNVIRLTSFYMLLLSLIYFVQALFCLEWLDPREFEASLANKAYADEVYSYSVQFERMKVVHALTLASISAFITMFTCYRRTLNQMHYLQLLAISLVVSILYFVPLVYIAYLAYDPVRISENGSQG